MNYEVVPTRIPRNMTDVEGFEQWLERIARAGGVLVTTLDSTESGAVLCVFRTERTGSLAEFKTHAF